MHSSPAVQAIESNLFDLCLTVARLSRQPYCDEGAIAWVNCAPSPWPNAILGARLDEADADTGIRLVVDQMAKGVAPRLWMTGPSTRPRDLEERLARHGFVKKSEAIGMACSLSHLRADLPNPPGLEIRTVSDDQALRSWARIVTTGLFQRPESAAEPFARVMSPAVSAGRATLYLATRAGRPAASSTLYVTGEVAGIYHVATLPDLRNRGIGRSITAAAALRARELGCRTAILQATQLGRPVYERLGFVELSRLGRFWLDAPGGVAGGAAGAAGAAAPAPAGGAAGAT
jgi:GNAT superfamily N-acetyltransferase